MSHLNCLRTMPEITDEAVIEALFAQRPYEEKVLNSAYLEIPAEYQRELSIPNIERMSAEFTEWIAQPSQGQLPGWLTTTFLMGSTPS